MSAHSTGKCVAMRGRKKVTYRFRDGQQLPTDDDEQWFLLSASLGAAIEVIVI
jgi:hypothetical protein